jgi:hypothetical protein
MSPEIMQRIVELLSNIDATSTSTARIEVTSDETIEEVANTREPKMMELEVVSEAQREVVSEVTTDSIKASDDIEINSTERITSSELPMTSEANVIKSESTTETSVRTLSEINAENDEGTAEISSRFNENENDSASEQESLEQAVSARQGRVNDSPTLFLHNNRFYVVSGAPEFYANFDAYQRPRTPIFSLQEMQPIRPMQKNVRVQKVEPFRIYVGDENENPRNNDEIKSEIEIEPLKMDDNENDSQARDIEMQSMKSTAVEVKKTEQASAGEGQSLV